MKTIFTSALIVTILLSACTQKPSVPQEPSANKGKTAESEQQIKIVKYDGTVQDVDTNYEEISNYYTELSPQIKKFYNEETPCKTIKSTSYVGYSELPSIYEKGFKTELKGKIDDEDLEAFIAATKGVLKEKNGIILSHLCTGDTEIYLTFWSEKYLYIALWDGDKFTARETMGVGKSDYSAIFIPNYFGTRHLLGSAMGDAGTSSWSFAEFDFSLGTIKYLEACDALNEWKEDGSFTNVINIQCEMEYSSTKGIVKYDEYQFDKCKNKQNPDEKAKCLSTLAEHDFTNYRKSKIEPENICSLIGDNEQKDKCFWGYAMNLKDVTLCDQITIGQKTKSAPINIQNCKEELNYENQGANWKLDSGIPYITNHILYEGSGKFKGWIVIKKREKSNFDKILFHVAEEDLNKLPPSLQKLGDAEITNLSSNFAITSLDHLPEYLQKSSADNPAIIEVQGIAIYDDQLDFWLDYEIELPKDPKSMDKK